jgi:uncharacterized membrane protein
MKVKIRKTRTKMTDQELRIYYEQVKNSSKVSRVEKKFRRKQKHSAQENE